MTVRLPLTAAVVAGVVLAVQSLQPARLRVFDAVAVWGPFARSFAEDGDLFPEWMPTLLVGFGRSVGLVAGSVSMLVGEFAQSHTLPIHPIYSGLLFVAVVLLGARLAGRPGAWVSLLIMLSSQLVFRGVLFHDDLASSFLGIVAVFMALRARDRRAWILVGVVAGGAFAMKLLGIVALGLVATVLIGRAAKTGAWLWVAVGWMAALPWYMINLIKFGNPLYPLASSVFGESEQIQILEADHTQYLQSGAGGRFLDVGLLALVCIGLGIGVVLVKSLRLRDAPALRWLIAIVLFFALFVASWEISGRAARHLLSILPLAAAVAAVGLTGQSLDVEPSVPVWNSSKHISRLRISVSVVTLFVALVSLTGWNVYRDLCTDSRVPRELRTGVYSALLGKWDSLAAAADPPPGDFAVHGIVGSAWEELRALDPGLKVFSFDNRWFFIPQEVLAADDVRAFAVYVASDAGERHSALRELGVGFVLDWRTFGPRHEFYDRGPWFDLDARPDLYRSILITRNYGLYEVRPSIGLPQRTGD